MRGFRAVLLVAALAGLVAASVLPTGAGAQTAPKTYVVDAVNSGGSRWVSADNGTSEITVEVGDTVRWEFDQATMGHNVTSNSSNWDRYLSEYRDPGSSTVEYTFTKTGEFRYTCTLHNGMTGIINVVPDAPANGAPTADPLVDPKTGPAPLYVHFEARASDPNGDPLTYRWDFGDGSAVSTTAHTHHNYTAPGNYTATLKVTDGKGGEFNRSFPISVSDGQAPTVTSAGANPNEGNAPLSVTFMASGQDPQGDPVTLSWDFGVAGTDADKATGNRVFYRYDQPGVYTATVTARDPGGNEGKATVRVTVNGETAPPASPEIEALADPASGEAPLEVAFSTRLTTRGEVEPLEGSPVEYAGVSGAAELSRSRGESVGAVHVEGLKANARYEARVHAEPCSSNGGGPVFRFDEAQPEGTPGNEIRMPFTADGMGMGMGGASSGLRAGDGAVSVVVHDASGGDGRVACATLTPDPADLAYSWDFDGDGGEDSAEPDPSYTYAAPGSYTAKVTVANAKGGEPVSDTVAVNASAANEPPDTEITAGPTGATKYAAASFWFLSSEPGEGAGFECSLDGADFTDCSAPRGYENLSEGTHAFRVRAVDAEGKADESPASRTWTVDVTTPLVKGLSPKAGSSTRDRTPTIQASAMDPQTDLAEGNIKLYLDGRSTGAFAYDQTRDLLRYVPTKALPYGSHTVKVAAADEAGNTTTGTWRFKVERR